MRLGFCGWAMGFGLLAVLAGCSDEPAPTCAQVDFDIGADQYLNNRFFALDDPAGEAMGRRSGERIQFSSLLVFRRIDSGPPLPEDLGNVAGYIDRNGYRDWPNLDFLDPFVAGTLWRPVTDFDPMVDEDGTLVGLDLRREQAADAVLAVVYNVEDGDGEVVGRVGDNPEQWPPMQELPDLDGFYWRMKLLKAPTDADDVKLHGYVWRNMYSLGETDIDPALFDLRIEALDDTTDPTLATPELPWIRLFGLDQRDIHGQLAPDGLPDLADPWLFDLHKGLIRFPREIPHPFAADPLLYQAYALPVVYPWEGSFLAMHLAPEIYAMATDPADFPLYRHFAIRGSIFRCPLP